ncbi:MAG: sugar transferase [Sphingomonas sp.]|nr:sugar transferase [Sphingomonas sp.]
MTEQSAVSGRDRSRGLLSRRRFQFAGALLVGAIFPWSLRGSLLPGVLLEPAGSNALIANVLAVVIAFWMRLSVETYPGIRRSYVILPSALTGHGIVLAWFLLTRFPYDRLALALGFLLHVLWLYVLYIYAERQVSRRIAVVPFGGVEPLFRIKSVLWSRMKRPRLADTEGCDAIVADFAADLPDEWEAFLADAALAGRIVYQHKQLAESLTGRVELEHLSENSFGSLLPVRGYFHLKTLIDFVFAVLILPLVLPLMAIVAVIIRLDSDGPALFRQKRVGHAGRDIIVYKFRTMRTVAIEDARESAMTREDDVRITKAGRVLRTLRIDELPQIFNILKWEMSWIGPRPEAEVLSGWAQVNQDHVAQVGEVHEKLQYDFYYIKYFSPWLDTLILLRTIKTMLTGFGSR